MRIPVIQGMIERRILANYRVDVQVLRKLLPPPFEPKIIGGVGIAGICLIRLKDIRPRHLPAAVGVTSENAAHRVAVEWDENGQRREGVYIFRRDTGSRLTSLLGGRVFPGVHHLARFNVRETTDHFSIDIQGEPDIRVSIQASLARQLPHDSIFRALDQASAFF